MFLGEFASCILRWHLKSQTDLPAEKKVPSCRNPEVGKINGKPGEKPKGANLAYMLVVTAYL